VKSVAFLFDGAKRGTPAVSGIGQESERRFGLEDSKLHKDSGEVIYPELMSDFACLKRKKECAVHLEFLAGSRESTEIAFLCSAHYHKLRHFVAVDQEALGEVLSIGKGDKEIGVGV
jgi:hypothetical protein